MMKRFTPTWKSSPEGGAVLENMWVEIKGKGNRSPIVVGAYYRVPDQGEEADDGFLTETTQLAWRQDTYRWGGTTSWTAAKSPPSAESRSSEQTLCWLC